VTAIIAFSDSCHHKKMHSISTSAFVNDIRLL
jgi:hypothetical protein